MAKDNGTRDALADLGEILVAFRVLHAAVDRRRQQQCVRVCNAAMQERAVASWNGRVPADAEAIDVRFVIRVRQVVGHIVRRRDVGQVVVVSCQGVVELRSADVLARRRVDVLWLTSECSERRICE